MVYGKITLKVMDKVENKDNETLALLESNYKWAKEKMVAWKLIGILPDGTEQEMLMADAEEVVLDEYVEI